MNKIRVKTKRQREYIESTFAVIVSCVSEDGCEVELNCSTVSFDEIAAIVDYLRPMEIRIDMSVVSENMREVVETWLAYKKEKNQSYKPTGFKTFYKRLCELSGNDPQKAMAIIEQSMANNYAGIFELKQNSNYGRETITDKIRRTVEEANKFSEQQRNRIGKQAELDYGDNDEVW